MIRTKVRYWFESTNHLYYENIDKNELKKLIDYDINYCMDIDKIPCYQWDIYSISSIDNEGNESLSMGI